MDLAAARIVNSDTLVEVKKGDLVEIIEPFTAGENFIGIVVGTDDTQMHIYHSDIRKTISWNRRVICNVSAL